MLKTYNFWLILLAGIYVVTRQILLKFNITSSDEWFYYLTDVVSYGLISFGVITIKKQSDSDVTEQEFKDKLNNIINKKNGDK